jgi:hypothetical protein
MQTIQSASDYDAIRQTHTDDRHRVYIIPANGR